VKDGKHIASLSAEFLKTELGELFVQQLSLHYNNLHQQAEEDGLSIEQKALKIERAAGVKFAITWLTSRDKLLAEGYWKEDASQS
jgi:hypothetical protein